MRSAPAFRTSAPSQPALIRNSEGNIHLEPKTDSIDHGVTEAPYEHRFSPYDFNGGTTVAVSGKDYAIVAADTRLSSGYEILSRNVYKLHSLTNHCVLGSAGCKTDVDQLRSVLDIKMKVSVVHATGMKKKNPILTSNSSIAFPSFRFTLTTTENPCSLQALPKCLETLCI